MDNEEVRSVLQGFANIVCADWHIRAPTIEIPEDREFYDQYGDSVVVYVPDDLIVVNPYDARHKTISLEAVIHDLLHHKHHNTIEVIEEIRRQAEEVRAREGLPSSFFIVAEMIEKRAAEQVPEYVEKYQALWNKVWPW